MDATYDKCRYLREWVAVKHRWRLAVESGEKIVLSSLAAGCSSTTITVTRPAEPPFPPQGRLLRASSTGGLWTVSDRPSSRLAS